MFTGIVEEVGSLIMTKRGAQSAALCIAAAEVLKDVTLGDSIAVNGVCLTVTAFTTTQFTADVMHETLRRTALGSLHPGSPVNLERAMPANGRFGGHIVSGHIDGTGVIQSVQQDDNALLYTIRAAPEILRYVVEKGSIAMDGISLTVARVSERDFCVSLIPHTAQRTALARKQPGDPVNLETDCIGKYVEKLLGTPRKASLTKEFLAQYGY